MKRETRINVRTTDQIKRELKVTARLRGLTESSLVNSLVVRAIREEKQLSPEAFEKTGDANRRESRREELTAAEEEIPSWQQGLRNARGMWKERNDLPDLRQLRKESDRSDRWDKD